MGRRGIKQIRLDQIVGAADISAREIGNQGGDHSRQDPGDVPLILNEISAFAWSLLR